MKNRFTLYLHCGYCQCWPSTLAALQKEDPGLAGKLSVISGAQCDLQHHTFPNWQKADTAGFRNLPATFSQALLIWEDGSDKPAFKTLNASQANQLHQLLRSLEE